MPYAVSDECNEMPYSVSDECNEKDDCPAALAPRGRPGVQAAAVHFALGARRAVRSSSLLDQVMRRTPRSVVVPERRRKMTPQTTEHCGPARVSRNDDGDRHVASY
eukprot:CAMPEP_0185185720 /NCGR_PEP_ID=MMETSP1140-20130426/3514_1 /TAXON_ID=298111 /ORGANISM="Pavlova sp., Strain CCMP459" /LENGTH=105 /DNA_ID=CAMNT_0027751933 /DNA_START=300 /DNA_END=617 /DNA_ORIENTATION=-